MHSPHCYPNASPLNPQYPCRGCSGWPTCCSHGPVHLQPQLDWLAELLGAQLCRSEKGSRMQTQAKARK